MISKVKGRPYGPLSTGYFYALAGQMYDYLTGLYCYGARCYDSEIGRFFRAGAFDMAAS